MVLYFVCRDTVRVRAAENVGGKNVRARKKDVIGPDRIRSFLAWTAGTRRSVCARVQKSVERARPAFNVLLIPIHNQLPSIPTTMSLPQPVPPSWKVRRQR